MKNYLIISLLILPVVFCQQKKSDQPNPYKGVRIKKILEFTYQPKFDDYIEIPTNDSIVVTYNTLGYKIDSTTYRTYYKFKAEIDYKKKSKFLLLVVVRENSRFRSSLANSMLCGQHPGLNTLIFSWNAFSYFPNNF